MTDVTPSISDPEQVVRQFAGFVRNLAIRIRSQLRVAVEVDDLVAYGYEGLLEARRRFDASRGIRFEDFAHYRVRMRMLDGLRAMTRLPRRARARLHVMRALDHATEAYAPRVSSTDATLLAIRNVLSAQVAAYVIANHVEPDAESPESSALRRESAETVRAAMNSLSEAERQLIERHYFRGEAFNDIAEALGISKSWASRMHAKALVRLRDALTEREPSRP
jgi:RNA polymerase sigma factor for flagellar operon FliA